MGTLNKNILNMIKGKNIIGLGSKRVVYDLGNGYVIKVARSGYGIASNKKEVLLYKSAPPRIKKYLASIIQFGDGFSWIVMKKYDRDFPKTKAYTRQFYEMKAIFKKKGIIPYEVSGDYGPNYQNIRLKPSGGIVVIDYGNFKHRR